MRGTGVRQEPVLAPLDSSLLRLEAGSTLMTVLPLLSRFRPVSVPSRTQTPGL